MLEAQAAGLPVVCSDADGLAENVAHGVTGLVVPRRDPAAFAAAIAELAADPERRRRMGEAGRERAARLFRPEARDRRLRSLLPRHPGESRAMRIDLILLGDAAPATAEWPLGASHAIPATPAALAAFAAPESADRLFFWAAELGAPDPQKILEIAARSGEVHHAGLILGQAARPRLLDFVHPTWMLHRDPPAEISASSWRLSLRTLLAPAELWREAPPRAHYRTLDAAALELGWRWLWRGALLRHQPDLVPAGAPAGGDLLPLEDELRFLRDTSGKKWTLWATVRAALSRSHGWPALWRAWRSARAALPGSAGVPPALQSEDAGGTPALPGKATVYRAGLWTATHI